MTPDIQAVVTALREMLPPQVDYAELVCAESWAHGSHYVWEDPEPYIISQAADIITQQQTELDELREANRWIPVRERLPESGEYVIALCALDDDENDTTYSIAAHMEDEWRDDYDHSVKDYLCLVVTHWQPLPQPPKEGE